MEKRELRKEGFQHALTCLAHPAAIFSMVLLFLNDFFFRVVFPGWWTGKLGDFVWLFFFPIFLASQLVWVLPKRFISQRNAPILIAIVFTGLVFTLGKTWFPFHQGLVSLVEWLFGWQVGWLLDPTDLIALVSLPACYYLWRDVQDHPRVPTMKFNLRWALIPMVVFLTMGNSARPDTGIICSGLVDNQIYVQSSYGTYQGSSGGMEWKMISTYDDENYNDGGCEVYGYEYMGYQEIPLSQIADPSNAMVMYQFIPGQRIERSIDGGATWTTDYRIEPDSEAEKALYMRTNAGHYSDIPGPYDANFEPEHGNLVMTMGNGGVLLRESDGTYHWISVGNYYHYQLNFSSILSLLFPGEVVMALLSGVLSMVSFRWRYTKILGIRGIMILCTVALLFYGIVLTPTCYLSSYIIGFLIFCGLMGLLGVSLFLFINSLKHLKQKTYVLLTFLGTTILFLLHFIAWGYNILPNYQLAFAVSMLLCTGWTIYRHRRFNINQAATETPSQ